MHRFIWLLRKKLKYVDAVYYCPHKFGVDLTESIMVGDRASDVQAGQNAGVGRCILVQTGLYKENTDTVECVSSLMEV